MTTIEKEALALLLRSKTALGRLTDSEVHSVLTYLEGLGWTAPAAPASPVTAAPAIAPVAVASPAPIAPVLTPAVQAAAHVAQVLPTAPASLSALASLEATIEKDVKAFFEPTPIAPPAA